MYQQGWPPSGLNITMAPCGRLAQWLTINGLPIEGKLLKPPSTPLLVSLARLRRGPI